MVTKILALMTALFLSTQTLANYFDKAEALSEKLSLESKGLSLEVLKYSLKGFDKIKETKGVSKEILTVIDFTKSSREKRLFTIDLKREKLLFHELVTHGKNTGKEYATEFSNITNSLQTSLGFYTTAETYYGKNGYSLRLDGHDKGYNDKARSRYIVMHGAPYANPSVIDKIGYLGRSWGCPAVREAITKKMINTVKGGSVLFHYYDDVHYLQDSIYLND